LIGIRNPGFNEESGIHLLEFEIQGVESRIQLQD